MVKQVKGLEKKKKKHKITSNMLILVSVVEGKKKRSFGQRGKETDTRELERRQLGREIM